MQTGHLWLTAHTHHSGKSLSDTQPAEARHHCTITVQPCFASCLQNLHRSHLLHTHHFLPVHFHFSWHSHQLMGRVWGRLRLRSAASPLLTCRRTSSSLSMLHSQASSGAWHVGLNTALGWPPLPWLCTPREAQNQAACSITSPSITAPTFTHLTRQIKGNQHKKRIRHCQATLGTCLRCKELTQYSVLCLEWYDLCNQFAFSKHYIF